MLSYDKFRTNRILKTHKNRMQEVTFPILSRSNLAGVEMTAVTMSIKDDTGKAFRLYMSVEEAKTLAASLQSIAERGV